MKTALTVAIGVAVLVAIAGVAGIAFVTNGVLPAPSAGSGSSTGPTSGGAGGTGGASGYGTLAVYVKDAPAAVNWTHVWVTFSAIDAHEANATNETGWHDVPVQDRTVDLASLTSVSALLGSTKLPAGMYTQLRLNVTSAMGVMQNGMKVNFTVPSNELKTTDPFNITVGQTTSLTLDIDLSRSIVQAGDMWLFLPVIGAVEQS